MGDNGNVVKRTGRLAVTGVVGVVLVDLAKKAAARGSARQGVVAATTWALRGKRQLEVGAENVRLAGGDIIAEARGRVGEQAPVPGADVAGHDHDH